MIRNCTPPPVLPAFFEPFMVSFIIIVTDIEKISYKCNTYAEKIRL
jgi:hypothetical protein